MNSVNLFYRGDRHAKKSVSFVQNGQKHLILACILTSRSCTTLENKGIYSRLNLPWDKAHLYKETKQPDH